MNTRFALLGLIALAACGGKVIVDANGAGLNGQGGAGGTSTFASSTGSDVAPIDCGPVCQKIIAACPWKEGHCECDADRPIAIKAGCGAAFNLLYGCVLDQPINTNCIPTVCDGYPNNSCILQYCLAHEMECWEAGAP